VYASTPDLQWPRAQGRMQSELLRRIKVNKLFYPVIHCVHLQFGGPGHALANIRLARNNGADGAFLIGHGVAASEVCYIYESVRKQHPDFWIGVNFLDISPLINPVDFQATAKTCLGLNGLWTDRMPASRLDDLPAVTKVYGGVAFKHQNSGLTGEPLRHAIDHAVARVDVITTSGDATGKPPSIEKLVEISDCVAHRAPIAVASGVNAGNVTAMKPYVDIFMIASSIIERGGPLGEHEYLIPEKVRELADLIHA
jgi:hypothetical protein